MNVTTEDQLIADSKRLYELETKLIQAVQGEAAISFNEISEWEELLNGRDRDE